MRGKFAAKPGQIESCIDPPNEVIVRHRICEVKLREKLTRFALQTAHHGSTSPRFASAQRNHGSRATSTDFCNEIRQKRTSCLLSSSIGPSVLRSYGFKLTRNCNSRAIGLLQCSSKRFPTSCPKTISAKDNLVSGTVVARANCYRDVRQSLLVGRKLGPLPLTVCIRLVRIAPCVAC